MDKREDSLPRDDVLVDAAHDALAPETELDEDDRAVRRGDALGVPTGSWREHPASDA